jgi:DNA-binding NarL/FixJ family response regulator
MPNGQENASSPPVASIRILVVDDFEPFRVFVLSVFSKTPEFQIICQASDGLEAVQKAEELKPDLILLDIGLPKLNGIQAARQIRELAPSSKLLFLSQESSADVVQEALDLGAMGYVVKAYAGSELLTAVEVVCQGRRFVSVGLSGNRHANSTNAQPLDCLDDKDVAAPVAPLVL